MPVLTEPLTAEALLALPPPVDGKSYELSDGELITVGNVGALHELIKTRIFELLTEYRLAEPLPKRSLPFAETVCGFPTWLGYRKPSWSRFHVTIGQSRAPPILP